MAVINTIREKLGVLVLVFIGVAILAFIMADLFGPGSSFSSPDRSVGEIAGQDINIQEFNDKVDELENQYQMRSNAPLNEAQRAAIRNQAWDALIAEKAFGKQFSKLGLTVTDEEMVDMVQGDNISPEIQQAFTNPETGEFDRNQLVNYLQNIQNMPPQQQMQWYMFEQTLRPARARVKYDNLLLYSEYVTNAEARREYASQNAVAEIKYLYIPYYSIGDSAVQVTDKELQQYIEKNKSRYQSEATRSVKYVLFPVQASDVDRDSFTRQLNQLKEDLAAARNDSLFAVRNSEGGLAFSTYGLDQLPTELQQVSGQLEQGQVYGPFQQEDNYVLYKLSSIATDAQYRARASHILIRAGEGVTPEQKAEARQKAEGLLKQLRSGADFAKLASENSDDPSASRGGDLGWFAEGRMVEPFEKAVFERSERGLVNRVVETNYGFHLINVTEPKTNQVYKVARVQTNLVAGDQTRNEAYRKAELFAAEANDQGDFDRLAKEQKLSVEEARGVGQNDRRVGNLFNARQLVMWLFEDNTDKGDVSRVFEVDDQYVVAVLTGSSEKGLAPVADVREEVTTLVKNEKKAKIIRDRLASMSGSLEEIAQKYGADASVYTASDLKPSAFSLATVGYAPAAVGAAFGQAEGARSAPIEVQQGIVMVETVNKTEPAEIADYAAVKEQVQQRRYGRTAAMIMEAIKEKAEIEDKRYRFF
ncbi:peptidylprolyl isomerase [Cesiribacter andamanensis]|uniref:Periplasmic chaperone PpiD n=1 Tax=Cesiribacter andamanensis AMV16 TaxID=1279009 RepID=M7NVC8_9BACT|nr:peptidylprolyl isomerase [Cesiribacter andamanensis]EMR02419.1 Foldase protein prsA precursor [Cesiribacter andamanensis AMV16]